MSARRPHDGGESDQPPRRRARGNSGPPSAVDISSLLVPILPPPSVSVRPSNTTAAESADHADAELPASLAHLGRCRPIGGGAYSTVYCGVSARDGRAYAVKSMKVTPSPFGILSNAVRELDALRSLSHHNIITMFDHVTNDSCHFFVLELAEGDLSTKFATLREKGEVMRSEDVINYTLQILNGVRYCHDNFYVHRDLKPENILLSRGTIKIADFGLCKRGRNPNGWTPGMQTIHYRAPELLVATYPKYNDKVDLWSVGCILHEMLVLSTLFKGRFEDEVLVEMVYLYDQQKSAKELKNTAPPDLPNYLPGRAYETMLSSSGASPLAIDLTKRLLCLQAKDRYSADDALAHEYFAEQIAARRRERANRQAASTR